MGTSSSTDWCPLEKTDYLNHDDLSITPDSNPHSPIKCKVKDKFSIFDQWKMEITNTLHIGKFGGNLNNKPHGIKPHGIGCTYTFNSRSDGSKHIIKSYCIGNWDENGKKHGIFHRWKPNIRDSIGCQYVERWENGKRMEKIEKPKNDSNNSHLSIFPKIKSMYEFYYRKFSNEKNREKERKRRKEEEEKERKQRKKEEEKKEKKEKKERKRRKQKKELREFEKQIEESKQEFSRNFKLGSHAIPDDPPPSYSESLQDSDTINSDSSDSWNNDTEYSS